METTSSPATPQPIAQELPLAPQPEDNRKKIALIVFLVLYGIGMAVVAGVVLMRNKKPPVSETPTGNGGQLTMPKPTSAPLCPDAEVAYTFEEAAADSATTCALYLSPRSEGSGETQGEMVMHEPRVGSAIGSLPSDIASIKNLKVLQANRNDLISVPSTFDQLQSLTHVSLSTNNFRVIPPDILSLRNLIALDMSRNMITEVPAEIGALSKLENLLLYGNRITALPPEIGQLQSLTLLQLSENRITRLPDTIRNLTNLTDLYLDGNPLEEGELERIKTLLPRTVVHF